MKSIKLLLFISLLFWLYGCNEDELLTYGEPADIYFLLEDASAYVGFRDSLEVTFMYAAEQQMDSVIRIPVKIMGDTAGIDRPFLVSFEDSTTGVQGIDYEIVSSFIAAGKVQGNLVVKMLRTEKLKKERVGLYFRMTSNEHFSTGFNRWPARDSIYDPTRMKLFFTDQFIMPAKWGQMYVGYFGTFSEKKMRLIAQIMNVPLRRIEDLTAMEMMGYAQALKRYLLKQKLDGTPVLEEDGTEMTTGPYI